MTAWYTVALGVMLVAYATATYVAVRHEFFEQLDDELHDNLESARSALAPAPDGRIAWSGERGDADADGDRRVEAWSGAGEAIYSSSASPGWRPAVLATASSGPVYASLVVNGSHWRTLTDMTVVGGRTVVLRVARSEAQVRRQLWEVLTVLVFGLPLIVVLAGAGGYVLARRALTPIDHLASAARRITAARLHDRLPVPNPHDEVGRLAAVINETIARLESSFEQLRRFTADASHELRTPLSVVRGVAEMGLNGTRSPAEYKDALASILEEVDRLTHLVDTLLRLSHGDAGTVRLALEVVDLGDLVREVVSSLGILAEERAQRFVIDAADGVTVSADRLVLREGLMNVVDNAIKYSPPASTITIGVRSGTDGAAVTVADQGPGVPADQREQVFDRFVRLDEGRSRDRGGTGLGLAIAKWAVEVNGGRISVDAGADGGAVFRIVLPVSSPAVDARRELSDSHTYDEVRQRREHL
jgi:heavy metal sensor kinase